MSGFERMKRTEEKHDQAISSRRKVTKDYFRSTCNVKGRVLKNMRKNETTAEFQFLRTAIAVVLPMGYSQRSMSIS